MAHLLLIRHGETLWNREKRFQGSTDIALSDKGRAQAHRVAGFFADKPLDAIYSSPLQRAMDTARMIAGSHGLDIRVLDNLQEINVGEWSGKTWDEIRRIWPELERSWSTDPYTSDPPPGGEVYREFQDRCIQALDQIAGAHADSEKVAVVCHGGVIRAIMNELLGLSYSTRGKIYSHNCSITRLRWKAGGTVVFDGFNDLCHLEEYC